jgi:hypothetical protein
MNHTKIIIDSIHNVQVSSANVTTKLRTVLANVCEEDICIQVQLRIKSWYTHWSRLKYFYFSFMLHARLFYKNPSKKQVNNWFWTMDLHYFPPT